MKNELEFKGTLSLQEALDMDKYRLYFIFRPIYRWLLYLAALFFFIMSLYRFYLFEFEYRQIIFLIISIYAMIGWKLERRYRIKKNFKANKDKHRESIVRFEKNSVYIKNSLMEASFNWKIIKYLIDAPTGILGQVANNQNLFFLPNHLFENNDKKQKILELVKSKDIMIKEIS